MQSDPIVEWLLQYEIFDFAYATGLRYAPALLLAGAFTFIYWFLPNTRVRIASALLGGVVASVLFLGAQLAYVDFNVGAAKYSVFFGAAATVPLLLVWIYVSMSIFLLCSTQVMRMNQSRCTSSRLTQLHFLPTSM